MFGSFVDKFDMNETEDGTEQKTFSFTPYEEYIEQKQKDEGKKEKKTRPKELKQKTNFLKIVKYSTNKHKIKQRPLMEKNIIPQHASAVVFCGRSGSGKSNLLVNLADRKEYFKDYFDLTFFFSPTCHHDDLPEYLDIPANRMFDSNFEPPLQHIIKTQKDIIERKGLNKAPKILIIFDDIISQKKFIRSHNSDNSEKYTGEHAFQELLYRWPPFPFEIFLVVWSRLCFPLALKYSSKDMRELCLS